MMHFCQLVYIQEYAISHYLFLKYKYYYYVILNDLA